MMVDVPCLTWRAQESLESPGTWISFIRERGMKTGQAFGHREEAQEQRYRPSS